MVGRCYAICPRFRIFLRSIFTTKHSSQTPFARQREPTYCAFAAIDAAKTNNKFGSFIPCPFSYLLLFVLICGTVNFPNFICPIKDPISIFSGQKLNTSSLPFPPHHTSLPLSLYHPWHLGVRSPSKKKKQKKHFSPKLKSKKWSNESKKEAIHLKKGARVYRTRE